MNLSSVFAALLAVMAAPVLGGCAATTSDTADEPVLTSDGEEAVDSAQDALHTSGCGFSGYNGYGSSHIGYGYGFGHGPGSYGYGNSPGAYGLGSPGGYGFGSGLGGYGSNSGGYGHSYGGGYGNGFGGFGTCGL